MKKKPKRRPVFLIKADDNGKIEKTYKLDNRGKLIFTEAGNPLYSVPNSEYMHGIRSKKTRELLADPKIVISEFFTDVLISDVKPSKIQFEYNFTAAPEKENITVFTKNRNNIHFPGNLINSSIFTGIDDICDPLEIERFDPNKEIANLSSPIKMKTKDLPGITTLTKNDFRSFLNPSSGLLNLPELL